MDHAWKKELAEDRGPARNDCLELYWKWKYRNTRWASDKNDLLLSVYPSETTLRIKPAVPSSKSPLPEMFAYDGSPMFLVKYGQELANDQVIKFAGKEAGKAISNIAMAKLEKSRVGLPYSNKCVS